ncbi:N-acetyl-gamma-glutamyl-phosphate reductase [Fictibacillus gelatini]|uniref:N-acetyl-gamma-glutamyl-phosphate reductase n=1 Tax=Fictibacillus gelatini TaxID=225985 RepID=UPI00041290F0|nr:N-acetyl-gamma-glutamyl-phosphate reductase [Fictibacillus gelatini]
MKVGIIGASGYGGVELIRLLHRHPYIESLSLYTSSNDGKMIDDLYPHLQNYVNDPMKPIIVDEMAENLDIVFSSAPSGVSTKVLPPLLEKGIKVIDLAGDYRLKNGAVYNKWYKKEPAPLKWLEKSVYGLCEWNKEAIKNAQLIANPGCYPTSVLLALGPLLNDRLIDASSIIIDAKSGVSGAGQSPSAATHFAMCNENFSIYKVNQHQHIPEIEQMMASWMGENSPVTFSTHLVPMTRGIMSTIYAQKKERVTLTQIYESFHRHYKDSPFVRIEREGHFPMTKQVYGSNHCDIGIALDMRTDRLTIVSCIDNLMKGAAGQAVQNFNMLFGFEETAGLEGSPIYP